MSDARVRLWQEAEIAQLEKEIVRLRAEVEKFKVVVEAAKRVRPFLNNYQSGYDGKPWAGTMTGSSAPLGELAEAVDELAALPAAADPAPEGVTE